MQALIQAPLPSGFVDMAGMAVMRICYSQPPAELALLWKWCDFALSVFEAELRPAFSLNLRPRSAFGTIPVRSVGWTMTRPRGRPRQGSA